MTVDIFLDGVPPRARSSELFEQLASAVGTGRLAPGDRLPTTRHLAEELGVARSTVANVYARLVAEGYAIGRVGDGTFVASRTAAVRDDRPATTVLRPARRPALASAAPTTEMGPPAAGWLADLRAGHPDPALFPLADWRRCVSSTLHRPPPGYGDPAGLPELRHAIAAWIGRSRGVDATADHVLVTAGAQGAFDLCARVLLAPGDVVAVEHPGYAPARAALTAAGAVLAPVPVDREGIDVDRIPAGSRMIVVTPSHQAPTGAVLSGARRRALLDHADRHDAVVVEDDYDTELRYVDRPLEPLRRLDARGRTVYVGSFSKTISPSLRLGFLVAPPAIVHAMAIKRRAVDAQPPHLTQAALTSFLLTGAFERHLRRVRRAYRARRDLLVDTLTKLAESGDIASFAPCPAGLHTVVRPPDGIDAELVAAGLRAQGIAIATTRDDRLDGDPSDLVIGFGLASVEQLALALDRLSEVAAASARQTDVRVRRR
jgi:GntR family transcriptional regulator/MocR family aminotransferase